MTHNGDPLPYLIFRLGTQQYALPIDQVVEVAAMVELVQTPEVNAEFLGLANRHGRVVPILDLRPIFGHTASAIDMTTLFIVAQLGSQMVGLVVDEVRQIVYVTPEQVAPASRRETYIQGVLTLAMRLIQVIALEAVLAAFLPLDIPESE
jgi:purine-binding chemotaxis protein CheW